MKANVKATAELFDRLAKAFEAKGKPQHAEEARKAAAKVRATK